MPPFGAGCGVTLSARVCCISGAATGIGAACARAFAAQGWNVAATLRQPAAASFEQGTGQVAAFALDVTDPASVDAAVQQALARFGAIDVLINNAGYGLFGPFETATPEVVDRQFATNVGGVLAVTRAVLPGMRERGFGRIINIGSIHALVASPYKSAYVAAKHGLVGFSKVLALETADTDITINTVCPSYVKTPLVDKQIADQARTRGISEADVVSQVMLKPMPKGVFIGLDELAGITAFLTSPAARNITGQTIVVDGGWTVQ